jgi:hypothetical protein
VGQKAINQRDTIPFLEGGVSYKKTGANFAPNSKPSTGMPMISDRKRWSPDNEGAIYSEKEISKG